MGKTGKEGLKRRCLGCEPIKIPPEAAQRAKQLIVSYQLDEVRDVSAGAATFYLWVWNNLLTLGMEYPPISGYGIALYIWYNHIFI